MRYQLFIDTLRGVRSTCCNTTSLDQRGLLAPLLSLVKQNVWWLIARDNKEGKGTKQNKKEEKAHSNPIAPTQWCLCRDTADCQNCSANQTGEEEIQFDKLPVNAASSHVSLVTGWISAWCLVLSKSMGRHLQLDVVPHSPVPSQAQLLLIHRSSSDDKPRSASA
eukprot:TRINITY_DN68034_c8_g5_i1.p2 TRINITY_DN68034_c8_g5~~TRINITY_DN68034_c8_g5_i1.p2  ORF type:complete len:165 (-),score=1.93 TRINITY_DN68034_c8_g5_i1:1491-1985(-)